MPHYYGYGNAFSQLGAAAMNYFAGQREQVMGGAAGGPGGGSGGTAKSIIDFFKGVGAGDVQARGIAAMLYSENTKFDPNAVNSNSGARGLAQWLSKDRLADFRSIYGHDLAHSTGAEQLEFIARELRGKYRPVGRRIIVRGDRVRIALPDTSLCGRGGQAGARERLELTLIGVQLVGQEVVPVGLQPFERRAAVKQALRSERGGNRLLT